MQVETKLVEVAMALRGSSPEDWDRFVVVLREYAASATRDLLRVAPEDLVRQQGIALGLSQLAIVLHSAPQNWLKHLERVKNGRPARTDSRTEIWPETSETDSGAG